MKRNSNYPSRNGDRVAWHSNFRNKLPGHATALSFAAGTVTAAQADSDWRIHLLRSGEQRVGQSSAEAKRRRRVSRHR